MSPLQIQLFQFEDQKNHFENLTTLDIDGEVWFVGDEVCRFLDIKNHRDAISRLDDDEKSMSELPTPSGNQMKLIVSESGLYALIFKSVKPAAKEFRRWITKEVIPAIRKTGAYGINRIETPNFVIRYNENWPKIDRGYFSVISELFLRLYSQFEKYGYLIPNKALNGKEIRIDTSVGITFAKYIRDKYPELSGYYKMYQHDFGNGVTVEARQYRNDLLPIFINFIDTVWLLEYGEAYFKDRDPLALEYLPKLLKGDRESQ